MAALRAGAALRRLATLPVVYTAAMYAVAGLGFAAANLLLARYLSTPDFALVTLLMALLNLSLPLATGGMDGVVVRRDLDLGPRMLRRVLIASAVMATLSVATGRMVYDLDVLFLVILFPSIIAGGATHLAAAQFRNMQRFAFSIWLSQLSNYVFLVAAIAMIAASVHQPWVPFVVVLMSYTATAVWAWAAFCRAARRRDHLIQDFPWRDALFYAGAQAAGLLLFSMERLLVPKLLTFEDLATLGVLGAVALAPYRILETAIVYTLLPRLRAATGIGARRRLVAYETAMAGSAILAAGLAVWYLAPLIAGLFVGDKYTLGPPLLLAVIVAGSIRVASSLPRASALAFCTTRELGHLAVLTWLAVGCALLGALIGAEWGLAGIIYGVGFGWLFRAVATAHVAARYLRRI